MVAGEYGIFPSATPYTWKVVDNDRRMCKPGIAVKSGVKQT
jgi:hypothetical protein